MLGSRLNAGDFEFLELLDKVSAAAYTCDPQGLITAFNSRAVELWGRAPKLNDPGDVYCGSYKLFSPDGSSISHNQCWMARALHENEQFNGRKIVIERPDGKRLTALAHANPIRGQSGTLLGAVNVLVDISDRPQAKTSTGEFDSSMGKLLATLAHELRNPLVPIRHMVDFLRGAPDLEADDIKKATDIIAGQVNQLTHLIDDLLDFGQTARGAYKVRKIPINLGDAIKEVAESLRAAIEARGHKLEIAVPAAPIIIEADAVRIAQITSNLLYNANQYMNRPGYISVELRRARSGAVLKVYDSGVGIPSDFLPYIFEPFVRADGFRGHTRGGLGLGLSITKTLVEMHGGTISATSSARGSTFTVWFPTANRGNCTLPSAHQKSAPHRILIIDDNAAAADSLAMLFESMGHDVSVAPDGISAITVASRLSPRVVFVDIDLPGMDGYEIARRLRHEFTAEQMLLVAATGYREDERGVRWRYAGFDYHLTKPIDIGDLESILASLDFVGRA